MKWARFVGRMEEITKAYKILTGKAEGKRSLGRPRRGWKDNIEMLLKEVGIRMWIGHNDSG
jgi:hypothetical protein